MSRLLNATKMVLAPTVKLSNGLQMPILGLGTYSLKDDAGEQAIKHAIDVGYRHMDTAYFYENEKEVGRACRAKIEDGTVKREDLFVVTKLWNSFHNPGLVPEAFQRSLDNLGLDYIDLYLMHMPMGYEFRSWDKELLPKNNEGNVVYDERDYIETWQAMEKLMDTGKVRALGISNYNSEQITRLLKHAKVRPVANQVECSWQLNQKKLTKFCKDLDIALIAYCPMGRLQHSDADANVPKPALMDDKVIEIGKKYNKTAGQIILKYLVQELGVIPIPKSGNTERIQQNIDIFDFTLAPEDCQYLDSLNTNTRTIAFNLCLKHKYYPFNIEF